MELVFLGVAIPTKDACDDGPEGGPNYGQLACQDVELFQEGERLWGGW